MHVCIHDVNDVLDGSLILPGLSKPGVFKAYRQNYNTTCVMVLRFRINTYITQPVVSDWRSIKGEGRVLEKKLGAQ